MRKFSKDTVNDLALRSLSRSLTGFPGSNPVHMYLRVGVINPLLNNRRYSRFTYHGKWSYSAYLRAVRVFNGLARDCRYSEVIEYTPDSILYKGTLTSGVYTDLRKRWFYSQNNPYRRLDLAAAYSVRPATAVQVGKRVLMCFEPIPENSSELGALKMKMLNNFKAGMGGLHRDI